MDGSRGRTSFAGDLDPFELELARIEELKLQRELRRRGIKRKRSDDDSVVTWRRAPKTPEPYSGHAVQTAFGPVRVDMSPLTQQRFTPYPSDNSHVSVAGPEYAPTQLVSQDGTLEMARSQSRSALRSPYIEVGDWSPPTPPPPPSNLARALFSRQLRGRGSIYSAIDRPFLEHAQVPHNELSKYAIGKAKYWYRYPHAISRHRGEVNVYALPKFNELLAAISVAENRAEEWDRWFDRNRHYMPFVNTNPVEQMRRVKEVIYHQMQGGVSGKRVPNEDWYRIWIYMFKSGEWLRQMFSSDNPTFINRRPIPMMFQDVVEFAPYEDPTWRPSF